MWWKRQQQKAIDADIAEARRLRAEAVEERKQLSRDPGLIATVVARRTIDPMGEEIQMTFTRRTT